MNKKFNHYTLFFALIFVFQSIALFGQNTFSLSGEWKFKIDSTSIGETQKWYNTDFSETVQLPGSMNLNGKGNDVSVNTPWTGSMWNKEWYQSEAYAPYRTKENTKVVFWLSPNKVYVGTAWYQREINIPANWKGKSVEISFERCHWETTLWVDGREIGQLNSLSVPHRYVLNAITSGKHKLTVRIDNRIKDIDPGVDAHSISDNTQTNWNGIVGEMTMESQALLSISNLKVFPNANIKTVRVEVHVSNRSTQCLKTSLQLDCNLNSIPDKNYNITNAVLIQKGDTILNVQLQVGGEIKLWDEFSPTLYTLNAHLKSVAGISEKSTSFGFRELSTKGTQITLNNRPVFFRGTLECCVFPKTGFPPTDVESWKRIFNIAKAHGLNHFRFHSWCPPKAAFDAADMLGIYFQIECDSWSGNIGSGKGIDNYVIEESKRIVDEFGNHPSFCLLAYGNEPGGEHHKEYLTRFVADWKNRDSRFLYTSAAGWPALEENDYHCSPNPRIQSWGEGNRSIINSVTPNSNFDWTKRISKTKPTISHEIGQWCVYPNLKERSKYTGLLKAKNFDIFEDRLRNSGLLQLADSFLLASGKLQTICYKADIEAALRTPGFAGFQLLGLNDFPGQGTALVGVLDAFWDEKGYVSPTEFSHFCNQTVPLVCMNKFVYQSGEELVAQAKVAHFGAESLENPMVTWKIKQLNGKVIFESTPFDIKLIPTGALSLVGEIRKMMEVTRPEQFKVELTVNNTFTNSWDIWVYPKQDVQADKEILICDKADQHMWNCLNAGKKVLLTPKFGTMRNNGKDSVEVGFSSIFWNTLWTNNQAPHTLGILCNPKHPAFTLFPTEFHSNYQWQEIIRYANAIPLNKFDEKLQPIVRIIDDWFKGRSLALAVEVKVGNGRLLIVGADLQTDVQNRPTAKQLMNSLVEYMKSAAFNPQIEVGQEIVESLFRQ